MEELAFLCKQLASNGPEINRLEAGMASPAFTLTSGNHYCLLFPPSEGLKALGEFISLFSSPKALVHLNDSASLKGTQPCWTRKRESKQTLIWRTRGTNCSLLWTWVCSWAGTTRILSGRRPLCGPLRRPGALKDFIHSTWVSNFLPSGYSPMADPITDKIDGSAWHAESTLTLFPFWKKKSSHTRTETLGQILSQIMGWFL